MKKYHPLISSNLQILTLPLITLLAFALLFTCANCNKDDDTQPKHNTFRCKVNGQDWEAYTYKNTGIFGMGVQGPTDLQYYDDTKFFSLGAARVLEDKPVDQSIRMAAKPTIIGKNNLELVQKEFKDWNRPGNCGFYDLDTTKTRCLTILAIDPENHIMEGTFEFTAIDDYDGCADTVIVTDGYFKLEYRF